MKMPFSIRLLPIMAGVALACFGVGAAGATGKYMGKYQAKLEGGTAVITLYTADSAVGTTNTISSLKGSFTETGGTAEDVSLLATGQLFGGGGEGNTATDNIWLNGNPLADPHLDTGGFGFGYGSSASDQYQVFYEGGQYKGCWGPGGCAVIVVRAVPEPGTWALMIGGFGTLGGALRGRRRLSASAMVAGRIRIAGA